MLLRYMSLKVKGLPPSMYGLCSPGTSSQLKSSSAGAIWMCKAFFTGSSCPLPCIWFQSLPNRQWLGWWFSHTCSICWIWSIVRSSIWSPLCIISHSSRNRMYGDTRLFTCGNVSLTLERIVMSQAWRLERNWRSTTTTVTRESQPLWSIDIHGRITTPCTGRRYQCIGALSLPDWCSQSSNKLPLLKQKLPTRWM